MRKVVIIALSVVLVLSVTGCGLGHEFPTSTPPLTITYGGRTVTPDLYTNEWNYVKAGSWTGYVADGIDPTTDEDIPVLEVSKDDLEKYGFNAVLNFGYQPDRVNDQAVSGDEITLELHDGINTIHAVWEIPDKLKGEAWYGIRCNIG